MTELNNSAAYWDKIIRSFSNAHLLQTWEWGFAKGHFGWQSLYVLWKNDGSYELLTEIELANRSKEINNRNDRSNFDAAALVLERKIPVRGFAQRMRVLYCPKGPLLDWTNNTLSHRVLNDLQTIAKQRSAIFLKIDPDVRIGLGIPDSANDVPNDVGITLSNNLRSGGWHYSDEQVQFRNTYLIDLTLSEDVLLANMKQKTRYNIRLAERKGVTIRFGDESDISLLHNMYVETSQRDQFIIREEEYYQTVMEIFMANPSHQIRSQPSAQPLIAEVTGEPVAALVLFLFARSAWYFYGMSREAHREKMPNYLLQWEAIRFSKSHGYQLYDLWGAPDRFDETDPMWGVFRFKEGLGGDIVRHIGAWDYASQPVLYRLYTKTIPRLLGIMRNKQKHQNNRMAG